jgi:aminoglycoside/choline kinase family phosphotransferase
MEWFESEVRATVSKRFGCPPEAVGIRPLASHASTRSYYRVLLRPEDRPRSLALMVLHGEDRGIKSDEIVEVESDLDELPFLNLHRFLRSFTPAVPEIYHHDAERGLIYLEDLGDRLLDTLLLPLDDAGRRAWYDRALDLLVTLQTEGTRRLDESCLASRASFTERLFLWEFEHFIEYGFGTRVGRAADPGEIALLRGAFADLARRLAALPKVFTHRDFQSKNILVQGQRLRLIDFQDALQGPHAYDLAALLRDSYVEISGDLLERLLEDYLDRMRAAGETLGGEAFRADFARMTLQRKLKDYGRFVYIDRVKGNPDYLRYNPANARYILNAASHVPEFEPARAVLESRLGRETGR